MHFVNNHNQTDFSIYPGTRLLGAPSDGQWVVETVTKILEKDTLSFGDAAVSGTEDYQCQPFDGSSLFFEGLVFRTFGRIGVPIGSTVVAPRQTGDNVFLVIKGRYFVKVANAVTKTDVVALNSSGEWVAGASGDFELQGASFLESGDTGDLVELELTGGRRLTAIS